MEEKSLEIQLEELNQLDSGKLAKCIRQIIKTKKACDVNWEIFRIAEMRYGTTPLYETLVSELKTHKILSEKGSYSVMGGMRSSLNPRFYSKELFFTKREYAEAYKQAIRHLDALAEVVRNGNSKN